MGDINLQTTGMLNETEARLNPDDLHPRLVEVIDMDKFADQINRLSQMKSDAEIEQVFPLRRNMDSAKELDTWLRFLDQK